MCNRNVTFLISMLLILSVFTVATPGVDAYIVAEALDGPYVDTLVYNVIEQDDQQVLALLNDEIDLIGDMVDPTFLDELLEAENVEVANVERNGYGYVVINTQKYPLDITDFRRALAFALDKEAISYDVWDSLSQPHDSPIPVINPWTIEGQLSYTYYEANIALGNYLLDRAGFVDIDADDIREAPDGSEFDVVIECAQNSGIDVKVGDYVADALVNLGVDAISVQTDFYEYLNRLYSHGDFDMVIRESTFGTFDVDWLAYEFWSEYIDEPYQNSARFANASFDSWRDQLLHATEHDDVYEAAIEMQKILVYECPFIVCHENMLISAYRTDKFEGHVNDVSDGVPGWWTNYKVHLKTGDYGGTFRWSNPLDIDTFNFMISSSPYANNINSMMWDSLIAIDGAGEDINWLAESYLVETHADNSEVPEGYTQFTFDMIQNATWTDGEPLTAEDAAFSLNYFRDSPGNPYGPDLSDMTAAYAPTTYRLIVQFNSESYWHIHTVSYKPIIPKHVFTVIGLDGWNLWNPNPPTTTMVTSGPFTVSDHVAGEFCEMTRNPNYFYSDTETNNPPTIETPLPITYVEGTTGNTIVWDVHDEDQLEYNIFLDEGPSIENGIWDGGNIITDIDGLSIGVHTYLLTVLDTALQFANAYATVTVVAEGTKKIVFDYSHGQGSSYLLENEDLELANDLIEMGYQVVWATGGINSSILADADGFIVASIYQETNIYSADELNAVESWFNAGNKFLWVGLDSDYGGQQYINDNMNGILGLVGSHVYGEPTAIEDPYSKAGSAYRAVANITSNDPLVSDIITGVSKVLMHGPTCLYGSEDGTADSGIVALEDTDISDVHPLLFYGASATIVDGDAIPPLAHIDGETGSFVAAALEMYAGGDESGVIITSGASPYADYRPMYTSVYYGVQLDGRAFVLQAIDYGMSFVPGLADGNPIVNSPEDISYYVSETGNSITWTAEDGSPSSYVIYINGSLVDEGIWSSSPDEFIINVDGLGIGVYRYMIFVYDTEGNFATDSVFVTVLDNNPFPVFENLGIMASMGVTIGSIAVIIVFSIVIFRSRKEGQWTSQYEYI